MSQYNFVGPCGTRKNFNKLNNQMILLVALAKAWYSISVEDLSTIACFLEFQEIAALPSLMKYPMIDFLLIGQSAQP